MSSPGILLVDALRSKYCPAEEEDAVHKETTVRDCGEVREFAIASRPGNAYRTSPRVPLWPSGLRRWFKAPAISMVWIRVPPLQFFFTSPFSLGHCCAVPAGRVPVGQLSTVVLERSGITHSGPGEELAELCPVVQQLCLGGNSISDWESVSVPNHLVCVSCWGTCVDWVVSGFLSCRCGLFCLHYLNSEHLTLLETPPSFASPHRFSPAPLCTRIFKH